MKIITKDMVNDCIDLAGYKKAKAKLDGIIKAKSHKVPTSGKFIEISEKNDSAVYVVSGGSSASDDSPEIAKLRQELKDAIDKATGGTGIQKDANGIKRIWQVTCYTLKNRQDNNNSN